ncbi:uncharacterized protein LOC142976482 [Anticarsia gemmatalis]|uniref:uncharacterized protein LOC142976482 n=1 Tax=Anticarsia gemmatalis TaxID=129554 RepID=UPI003F75B9DB
MLRLLVPLLCSLSAVTSLQERGSYSRGSFASAASPAQIKFAIENKYDDTGPGAKQKEYAYNTYKNLEDALIAYLDDPDTKLPDHERAKAVQKLLSKSQLFAKPELPSYFQKNKEYDSFKKPIFRPHEQFNFPGSKIFFPEDSKPGTLVSNLEGNDLFKIHSDKKIEPHRFQKYHTVKGSSLSLAHYTRDKDLKAAFDDFNPFPHYSFSYGVHDKATGDSKQASETRQGDTVRGFYSFLDSDGQQRVVHYTADDLKGFRANIKKIPTLNE